MFGKKIIRFSCVPEIPPYHVLQYLEGLGVYVWPVSCDYIPNKEDCQYRYSRILVNEKQYIYASGLIKGYMPSSVVLYSPENIKSIKPKNRWGKPAYSKGFMAVLLRITAYIMGFNTKLPPKRNKKRRANV